MEGAASGGGKLKCPAAKWLQPFCRLKCQPEVTDLDPAKSTDTQTSSWEPTPQGPHGHTGHSSRLHRRVLSPTPDRRPLAGGWTVGVVGRGCHPPSCRPQGVRNYTITQSLRGEPEGSHCPAAGESRGPGPSPGEPERGHTHTHIPTSSHRCTHVYTCAHPLPHTHSPHILTPTQTPAHMLTYTPSTHITPTHVHALSHLSRQETCWQYGFGHPARSPSGQDQRWT